MVKVHATYQQQPRSEPGLGPLLCGTPLFFYSMCLCQCQTNSDTVNERGNEGRSSVYYSLFAAAELNKIHTFSYSLINLIVPMNDILCIIMNQTMNMNLQNARNLLLQPITKKNQQNLKSKHIPNENAGEKSKVVGI